MLFFIVLSYLVTPSNDNSQIHGMQVDPEDSIEFIQVALPLEQATAVSSLIPSISISSRSSTETLLSLAPTLVTPTLISLASLLLFYWMNRSPSNQKGKRLRKVSIVEPSQPIRTAQSELPTSEFEICISGAYLSAFVQGCD